MHRESIGILLISVSFPMDPLLICYGFRIDFCWIRYRFLWLTHGLLVDSLWIPDGFPMEFLLDSYRILISFSWIPYGFPMHSLGIPWIAIDFPWIP